MSLEATKTFPQAPIILRIGVFFDGTGNNQANAVSDADNPAQGAAGSYANALSNVALLHRLYPEGEDAQGAMHCMPLYVEGVGTQAGAPDLVLDQASGVGPTGVEARVQQALQWVAERVRAWPQRQSQRPLAGVEFDLFGFSRGAAAARHFANRVVDPADRDAAWAATLERGVALNFIGLFDTVAAILDPTTRNPVAGGMGKLRLGLAEGIARQVWQLVAAHEHRHNFPLVASGNDLALPGVHADIGGGYLPLIQEAVLMSQPFSCQVALSTAVEATAAYRNAAQALSALPMEQRTGALLRTWEVPGTEHNARREAPSKWVYAAPCREREVSGALSRVYLSVMRERACAAGVPFAALDALRLTALPGELVPISACLHDYALGRRTSLALDAEQQALLQRRYIHASAHWNAVAQWRDSVLDPVFVNRPAAEGVRKVHANPVG
ncbi:T6SS phospholipase effector Tle1-like catalytic domain-containing protein [Pseudomonas phoenicis]|uniref:T6SS phospholipase effector Tle1-like catalytic domain-containing protein n=1 Tax=unclassified Pseudomonas TaxID=196821 RepID=UPI0039A0AB58